MNLKNFENSWILSSGIIGCENQCLGVIERLGIKTKIINLKPSRTLSYLAPFGFPIINPQVQPPWPDLAIAAGRKTIPYLRYIRKVSMKKCKTIYLQDPRIKSKNFDIVWAPNHDSIRGPNVINTVTSPNRVNEKLLNYHYDRWHETLNKFKRPIVGFLIGGRSKSYNYYSEDCKKIIETLNFILNQGFTPLVTLSRRSPKKLTSEVRDILRGKEALLYDGKGENPYFAILKASEIIIATPDSANMISEAINVPKPVYYVDLKCNSKRYIKFIDTLVKSNHIRPFAGNLSYFQNKKMDPTQEIVDYIHENLF